MMRHVITKKKSWFYSPWVSIVLVFLLGWGIVAVVRSGLKQRDAFVLRNESQQQMHELEQTYQELNQKIEDFSTQEGIEAEIRQRYRVVKPGEQLVIVVDNKESDEHKDTKKGVWQKIQMFVGF